MITKGKYTIIHNGNSAVKLGIIGHEIKYGREIFQSKMSGVLTPEMESLILQLESVDAVKFGNFTLKTGMLIIRKIAQCGCSLIRVKCTIAIVLHCLNLYYSFI